MVNTHLLVHELEVLGLGVQGCHLLPGAALPVQAVEVVQADDSGHVADQGVAIRVATCTYRAAPELELFNFPAALAPRKHGPCSLMTTVSLYFTCLIF